MIGGGLRSLAAVPAVNQTPFHGADGAGALQGIAQQWPPIVAIMIGAGLEGSSLAREGLCPAACFLHVGFLALLQVPFDFPRGLV